MASNFLTISRVGVLIPGLESQTAQFSRIYSENCHRIYSLAFWMTDHEQVAEQVATNVFLRAFASGLAPSAEQIDRALLEELRDVVTMEGLTLCSSCDASAGSSSIGRNMKRVHMERAVVQLPATEKLIFLLHDVEGYAHVRIARLLGITEGDCRLGLHQARLRVRELVSKIQQT
jgi:RNA polymerase sigma-70 factor (ECF subfamily)